MATARRTGTNESGYHGSGWTDVVDTFGGSGQGRDYTSLSTWEADTDVDLTTSLHRSPVLECYDDETSYDQQVTINGATANSTYFRIVRPAGTYGEASWQGHNGTPATGVWIKATAPTWDVVDIRDENYAQVQDLIVTIADNQEEGHHAFLTASTGTGPCFVGCIAWDCINAGAGDNIGFGIFLINGGCIDCLALNIDTFGFGISRDDRFFYNCTAVACGTGFYNWNFAGASLLINCLALDCGTDFDINGGSWDANSDHNACDGSTATGGSNDKTSIPAKTYLLTDEPNDDCSLLRDVGFEPLGISGEDLSSDLLYAFDDDLEWNTISNRWPIGAFWPGIPSCRRQGARESGYHTSAWTDVVDTYGTASRDYSVLNTWESDTDVDLTTSLHRSPVLECYDDETNYDDETIIVGATANDWYFRIVRPAGVRGEASWQGHDGTPNNGVWFRSTDGSADIFRVQENNALIQDLVLTLAINSASGYWHLQTSSAGVKCSGIGLIAANSDNQGSGGAPGIGIFRDGGVGVNCLAADIADSVGFGVWYGGTRKLVNCTAENCASDGAYVGGGNGGKAVNCLITNSGLQDFDTDGYTWDATNSKNNASGDATAPGVNSRTEQSFSFVSIANDDYQLGPYDPGAKGYGLSMLDDSLYPFFDDLDGEAFDSGAWDIGALKRAEEEAPTVGVFFPSFGVGGIEAV